MSAFHKRAQKQTARTYVQAVDFERQMGVAYLSPLPMCTFHAPSIFISL